MDDINNYDDLNLSPNTLLNTFESAIDDEIALNLNNMVDNDPWIGIGNGICDSFNLFNHNLFVNGNDDDDNNDMATDSCKSSSISSNSPLSVNIKCEVEDIDNEIEINSDEFNDADSPLSYGSCHSSGSSMSQTYDNSHNYVMPRQVVIVGQSIIKKEPQNGTKTSPKSSPKSRTPRNKQITDLVLTDEEKRLLTKEGYSDFPCGNLPLTKHEEKILRKIRRKIRNKKSAQCSRQRKKEYLEDLERRFEERNHENEQLKKEVIKLKKENDTLLVKMKKVLSMNGHSNASFKSSFFVIILSFLLILVPYFRTNEENFGVNDKDMIGTGRHLLMTINNAYADMGNSIEHELNETIFNYTTITNTNLI